MRNKLHFLFNPLLLIVLVAIITLPVLVSTTVIRVDQSSGEVAGFQTISDQELVVYPNFTDFDGYVRFEPQEVMNGRYQDTLTITVFRNQSASYHQIYRIYNRAEIPMRVKVSLDQVPVIQNAYSHFLISLSPSALAHYETLLRDEQAGSTVLEVRNPRLFADVPMGSLGKEVVKIWGVSERQVTTLPLTGFYSSGERFYPQAVLVVDGKVLIPETREVILESREYATVSLTVVGRTDSPISVTPMTLSFSIDGRY